MAVDNVANSNVYQGREGTGAAQILGNSINPMMLVQNYQANRQKEQAARQKAQEQAKAARDERLRELFEFSPEDAWAPDQNQINDQTKEYLSWVADQARTGNTDSIEFMKANKDWQQRINLMAKKSQYAKENYNDIRTTYKEDPRFITEYYDEKLNDEYFGVDEAGVSIMQRRIDTGRDVTNDVGGYNMEEIYSQFVDGLPERIIEKYEKQEASGLGVFFDKDSFVSKLFVPEADGSGKIKVDKNGNPMINLTPEVYRAAMQDPLISNYVNSFGGDDEKKKKEFLAREIASYGGYEYKNTPSGITKWGSGQSPEDKQKGLTRIQNIYEAVNGANSTALKQATQDIEGIDVSYTYPTGPGESGNPTEIVVSMDRGYIPGTDEKRPSKIIKIPVQTPKQKEDAARRLNKLIDEATNTGKLGADKFDKMWKDFTKNKKSIGINFGEEESSDLTEIPINWE